MIMADNNDTDSVPENYDVIWGRGKISHEHVGNRRFCVILNLNQEKYNKCTTKYNKTRITESIVSTIRGCGGRFLKIDSSTGKWFDVGDRYARDKISHALRNPKVKSAGEKNKGKKREKKEAGTSDPTIAHLLILQQQILKQLLEQSGSKDIEE